MKNVLYAATVNNVLAGIGMIVFYHEGFKMLGIPKPGLKLPIQLVGIFVLLFGVGYYLVARNPVENRNLLFLGFLSKLLGSMFGLFYVANGSMPLVFVLLLLVADIAYLPPFAIILRRLYRAAGQLRDVAHKGGTP